MMPGNGTIVETPTAKTDAPIHRRQRRIGRAPRMPVFQSKGLRLGRQSPVLSILIPVFNERRTIHAVLKRLRSVPFPVSVETILVDDGSTDGSAEALRDLPPSEDLRVLFHKRNLGKGSAIRTALRYARGSIIVVQDADLELDPDDLVTLLEPLRREEAAVCYGSRFSRSSRRLWLAPTYWANRFLNFVCNRLNGLRLTDMNTCYKMMRADVARRIDLVSCGFSMEVEITTKLAGMGVPIVERPVRYTPRRWSEGKKISPLDFFRYLAAMIRFRFFPRQTASRFGAQPSTTSSKAEILTTA